MRKATSLLFCIIGLLFFAGCTLDDVFAPKPLIRFIEGDGLYSHNSIASPGETLSFKVEITPNDSASTALKSYSFRIFDLNHSSSEPVYENYKSFDDADFNTHVFTETYTPKTSAYLKVVAQASDAENISNEVQFVIDVLEPGIRLNQYDGTLEASGILHSDFSALNGVTMTIPVNTVLYLDSIPGKDQLNATFIVEGFPVTVECARVGGQLSFDEIVFSLTFNHVENIDMEFKANLIAENNNNDDSIKLNGQLSGNGHTSGNTNFTSVDWDEGLLTGELQKVQKSE